MGDEKPKQDANQPWATLRGTMPVDRNTTSLPGKADSSTTAMPAPVPDFTHQGALAKDQFGGKVPVVPSPDVIGTRYQTGNYTGQNTPPARAKPVQPEIQP